MTWRPIPADLRLARDEVHVFRARIDAEGEEIARARSLLSPDETARAARFKFDRHREPFIRAHAFARRILSRLLATSPSELRFTTGTHGKPALEDGALELNLSHSGGWALLAAARGRPVGVDVERHRPEVETLEIAERFFTPTELAVLRSLEGEARVRGFFLCWTRKEAYIKARGEGLSIPLSSFDVTCRPGEEPAIAGVGEAAAEVARWSLAGLGMGSGYEGAVAALGYGWPLVCWDESAALTEI